MRLSAALVLMAGAGPSSAGVLLHAVVKSIVRTPSEMAVRSMSNLHEAYRPQGSRNPRLSGAEAGLRRLPTVLTSAVSDYRSDIEMSSVLG